MGVEGGGGLQLSIHAQSLKFALSKNQNSSYKSQFSDCLGETTTGQTHLMICVCGTLTNERKSLVALGTWRVSIRDLI